MINRKFLFDHCRKDLFPVLKQKQVDGINAILDFWEFNPINTDHRKLAYMLATVYHETAFTMQPIEERGSNNYFIQRYWENKKVAKWLGNLSADDAVFFRGRGFVQLTGRANYEKFQAITALKLVTSPWLACEINVAVTIMFVGMEKGTFTGRKLSDYFNGPDKCDWLGARAIINGRDKAKEIAIYANQFLQSISTI